MKRILLILLLEMTAYFVNAQTRDSVVLLQKSPHVQIKDAREFSGFAIRLVSKDLGNYSFDIFSDRKVLLRHFQNPLPFSPKGVQKKEDAYKIAQWIITDYKKTGHWDNMVPPHIARQLGIEVN